MEELTGQKQSPRGVLIEIYKTVWSKLTEEHICQNVVSIKLHSSEWIFPCKFASWHLFIRKPLGTVFELRVDLKFLYVLPARLKSEMFSKMNFLDDEVSFNKMSFKCPGFSFFYHLKNMSEPIHPDGLT